MNALLTKATTRATARSSSVLFGTVTSRTAKRSIYSYASSSSSASLLSSSLPLWNEDTTTSPSSLSVSASSSSPKFFLNAGSRRYLSTTTNDNNDKDENDDNDDDDTLEGKEKETDGILYTSPMGNLISRLKIVSITSCVMSIIGLPCMIYIKNGDWPNAKQLGMGGIAFMGATGSTLALHFVFGPYILEMKEIPVRVCSSTSKDEDEDDEATTSTTSTTTTSTSNQDTLLEATTRSVFGWKKRHVFDPTTDITPFVGIRPFANFVVKETTPLYVHPELLDEVTKKMLLSHLEIHNDDNDNDVDEDEDEDDDESVVVGDDNDDSDILEKKQKAKEAKKKKKKKDEQDDDFLL